MLKHAGTIKKLAVLFLTAALLAVIFGCAETGPSGSESAPVSTKATDTEAPTTEQDDKQTESETAAPVTEAPPEAFTAPMNIDAVFTYSYDKPGKTEKLASSKVTGLCLAKSEFESITLVVQTEKDRTVNVETPTLTDGNGNTLTAKEVDTLLYVDVRAGTGGTFPDVVMPLKKGKLDLKAGVNNLIYILFETKANTPAGEYTGHIRLTGDGEFKEIPLTVKVWDFILPATPNCRSAFGLSPDHLYAKYGVSYGSSEADEVLMKANYFLLDHKISSLVLPFDILNPLFDEYLQDDRVTSFRITHSSDEAKMKEILKKLNELPDDLYEKGLYYLVDEPVDEAAYAKVKAYTDDLKKLTNKPIYQIVPVSTMNVRNSMQSKSMQDGCTVWCPISATFGKAFVTDFLETRRELGQKVWWYCCRGVDDPLCNMYQVNAPGLNTRSYFWQMYDYKVEGLLYWSVSYWSFEPDDADEWTKHIMPGEVGDGSLIYASYNRIYSSLRLEIIRDGIEDYDYLTMAEQLFGREKIDELVDSITTSVDNYNKDVDLFAEIREKIGAAIESGKL